MPQHGRVMRRDIRVQRPLWDLGTNDENGTSDAAAEKLVEAAKLLDCADEDTLADDALELAERVNLRISVN